MPSPIPLHFLPCHLVVSCISQNTIVLEGITSACRTALSLCFGMSARCTDRLIRVEHTVHGFLPGVFGGEGTVL